LPRPPTMITSGEFFPQPADNRPLVHRGPPRLASSSAEVRAAVEACDEVSLEATAVAPRRGTVEVRVFSAGRSSRTPSRAVAALHPAGRVKLRSPSHELQQRPVRVPLPSTAPKSRRLPPGGVRYTLVESASPTVSPERLIAQLDAPAGQPDLRSREPFAKAITPTLPSRPVPPPSPAANGFCGVRRRTRKRPRKKLSRLEALAGQISPPPPPGYTSHGGFSVSAKTHSAGRRPTIICPDDAAPPQAFATFHGPDQLAGVFSAFVEWHRSCWRITHCCVMTKFELGRPGENTTAGLHGLPLSPKLCLARCFRWPPLPNTLPEQPRRGALRRADFLAKSTRWQQIFFFRFLF